MKIDEITKLKILAGIIDDEGKLVNDSAESNISITGSNKSKYQTKHKVIPGTDEWFKLWFSKPKLTGENPTPKDKG
jgi:hypothetical protein|tara:strand:+ start:50 stop:277 length:228 start_codon:yes stop_codon:yes gene_type:complete